MRKSVKLCIVIAAVLAIILGTAVLGSRGRRAEAMYGGAVLILNEKVADLAA